MTNGRTLIVPLVLIAVGLGWLLTELEILPGIDWVWTLGLAVVGLLAFLVSGFDKVSIVLGPFFLAAAGLSLLRQRSLITLEVELPILIMLAGALLLFARLPTIPAPRWLGEQPQAESKKPK